MAASSIFLDRKLINFFSLLEDISHDSKQFDYYNNIEDYYNLISIKHQLLEGKISVEDIYHKGKDIKLILKHPDCADIINAIFSSCRNDFTPNISIVVRNEVSQNNDTDILVKFEIQSKAITFFTSKAQILNIPWLCSIWITAFSKIIETNSYRKKGIISQTFRRFIISTFSIALNVVYPWFVGISMTLLRSDLSLNNLVMLIHELHQQIFLLQNVSSSIRLYITQLKLLLIACNDWIPAISALVALQVGLPTKTTIVEIPIDNTIILNVLKILYFLNTEDLSISVQDPVYFVDIVSLNSLFHSKSQLPMYSEKVHEVGPKMNIHNSNKNSEEHNISYLHILHKIINGKYSQLPSTLPVEIISPSILLFLSTLLLSSITITLKSPCFCSQCSCYTGYTNNNNNNNNSNNNANGNLLPHPFNKRRDISPIEHHVESPATVDNSNIPLLPQDKICSIQLDHIISLLNYYFHICEYFFHQTTTSLINQIDDPEEGLFLLDEILREIEREEAVVQDDVNNSNTSYSHFINKLISPSIIKSNTMNMSTATSDGFISNNETVNDNQNERTIVISPPLTLRSILLLLLSNTQTLNSNSNVTKKRHYIQIEANNSVVSNCDNSNLQEWNRGVKIFSDILNLLSIKERTKFLNSLQHYPNCGLPFKSQRGVLFHERRDPRHNPSMIINRFSNGGGNKERHQISYEYSKDVERNIPKKIATGPQFVDMDILKSMIDCNNSNVDKNYFGYRSDDEGDETIIGKTEILHNKDLVKDYNFECKKEKISYYVYSLLEAICFQCGFFTWEVILLKPFDELVTLEQEVHVLAALHLCHGRLSECEIVSLVSQDMFLELKNELRDLVAKDRYYGDKAPLFRSRIAEFRQQLFGLADLLPKWSNATTEVLNTTTASNGGEEEAVSDEIKLYRVYAKKKASGQLSTSILMNLVV